MPNIDRPHTTHFKACPEAPMGCGCEANKPILSGTSVSCPASQPECFYCGKAADGPMLSLDKLIGGRTSHVTCVIDKLNRLLDPDYDGVEEPLKTVGFLTADTPQLEVTNEAASTLTPQELAALREKARLTPDEEGVVLEKYAKMTHNELPLPDILVEAQLIKALPVACAAGYENARKLYVKLLKRCRVFLLSGLHKHDKRVYSCVACRLLSDIRHELEVKP